MRGLAVPLAAVAADTRALAVAAAGAAQAVRATAPQPVLAAVRGLVRSEARAPCRQEGGMRRVLTRRQGAVCAAWDGLPAGWREALETFLCQ
jgi:hypothetical protein